MDSHGLPILRSDPMISADSSTAIESRGRVLSLWTNDLMTLSCSLSFLWRNGVDNSKTDTVEMSIELGVFSLKM